MAAGPGQSGRGEVAREAGPLVIVQARLSSSRLPGKVLLEVAGRTLLAHLLSRLRRSMHPLRVVVATTTHPADDRVEAEARRSGVNVFRGSEADVLARFAGALREHPADVVVRLTADNPLLDPAELDRVLGEFLNRGSDAGGLDYATNHTESGGKLPLGLDVEVFRADALERADREARDPGDREHVTPYLYRVPGRFRVLRTPYPRPELSRYRLTVDTPRDLQLLSMVLGALGPDADLPSIARFLDLHPEVAGLNASVVQRSVESELELRRRRIAGRYLVGRADASAEVGFGHAMRIGTLLEAWTELGGRALFIGRGLTGSLAARLASAGVELGAPAVQAPEQEAESVVEHARSLSAAAIAIDGYTFDVAYHEALGATFPLLAIDDLAAWQQTADVVINQNLDFERARYGMLGPEQRLLTGAPYVLLRRALRERLQLRAARVIGQAPRVVVGFGGSDPLGLSEPVVEALLEALPSASVEVLLGPGVERQRGERLQARAESEPRLLVHVDPPEIGAILLDADVLVSAAGVTTWEALALGVPVVLVTIADNQRAVAAPLFARGAALDAGWVCPETPRSAAQAARQLLLDPELARHLSSAGPMLIDGRGVWRVIDALLDTIDDRTEKTMNVSLRAATREDRERTFSWANDPETRAASFNSRAIEPAEHERWFESSLVNPLRVLLIAEHDGEPFGLVRLDRDEPGRAELSLALAPERRGQGLALPVLMAAAAEARSLGITTVVARIRPENERSLRSFAKAGFVLVGNERVAEQEALRYELRV